MGKSGKFVEGSEEPSHPTEDRRVIYEAMAKMVDETFNAPVNSVSVKFLRSEIAAELILTEAGPAHDALLAQDAYLSKVQGVMSGFLIYLDCLYNPLDEAGNTAGPEEIADCIRRVSGKGLK